MRAIADKYFGAWFVEYVIALQRFRSSFLLLLLFMYPFIVTSTLILLDTGSYAQGWRLAVSLVYNAGLYLIFILSLSVFGPSVSSILTKAVLAFSAAYTFLSVLHYFQYSQLIGVQSIYAVIDTTSKETAEYLISFFGSMKAPYLLAALLSPVPLLFALFQCPSLPYWNGLPLLRYPLRLLGISVLVGVAMLGTVRSYLWQNNPIMMTFGSISEAVVETAELKRALAEAAKGPLPQVGITDGEDAVHILILGESATRRHMSLYGYGRETSPLLRRMAPELEIATDACSSRATTSAQMKELLTFATREDDSLLTEAPNLLQLMKAGGFTTYWLSNQQVVGSYDRWAGIFAQQADVQRFVNLRGWDEGVSYDEKLLPPLKEILSDNTAGRRFIVVHLLGSHQAYDLRYPPQFQRFEGLAGADESFIAQNHSARRIRTYNSYDNAILYNDFIVNAIIQEAKKLNKATVVYLSDHGESVGEVSNLFGHMDGPGPRQMYEIPLLFYWSPSYKSDNGGKLEALRSNLKRPIQSDQLIHTLLDMYGLDYRRKETDQSLLSTSFQPKKRYCDTLEL